MKILSFSVLIFGLCYFTMRFLKVSWEKGQFPKWSKYLLGILAWGVFLSFCGILWEFIQPIIKLFTEPAMGLVFQLGAYAIAVTMIAKLLDANPELFDFAAMKPFLKDSLAFADPARRRMCFADELDKRNVQRIYKETTGKDLPEYDEQYDRELRKKPQEAKKDENFSHDKQILASKKTIAVLQKPIESPHTKEELRQLHEGSKVDISDSWFLSRQKKSSHQYFHLVKKVIVDPASERIDFALESKQFTNEQVRARESLYRLKQNLYEFLQAVQQQDWMQSYLHYVSLLSCTCCHVEDEGFGSPQVYPICRVELSRAYLKTYENKFFDVGNIKVELFV